MTSPNGDNSGWNVTGTTLGSTQLTTLGESDSVLPVLPFIIRLHENEIQELVKKGIPFEDAVEHVKKVLDALPSISLLQHHDVLTISQPIAPVRTSKLNSLTSYKHRSMSWSLGPYSGVPEWLHLESRRNDTYQCHFGPEHIIYEELRKLIHNTSNKEWLKEMGIQKTEYRYLIQSMDENSCRVYLCVQPVVTPFCFEIQYLPYKCSTFTLVPSGITFFNMLDKASNLTWSSIVSKLIEDDRFFWYPSFFKSGRYFCFNQTKWWKVNALDLLPRNFSNVEAFAYPMELIMKCNIWKLSSPVRKSEIDQVDKQVEMSMIPEHLYRQLEFEPRPSGSLNRETVMNFLPHLEMGFIDRCISVLNLTEFTMCPHNDTDLNLWKYQYHEEYWFGKTIQYQKNIFNEIRDIAVQRITNKFPQYTSDDCDREGMALMMRNIKREGFRQFFSYAILYEPASASNHATQPIVYAHDNSCRCSARYSDMRSGDCFDLDSLMGCCTMGVNRCLVVKEEHIGDSLHVYAGYNNKRVSGIVWSVHDKR